MNLLLLTSLSAFLSTRKQTALVLKQALRWADCWKGFWLQRKQIITISKVSRCQNRYFSKHLTRANSKRRESLYDHLNLFGLINVSMLFLSYKKSISLLNIKSRLFGKNSASRWTEPVQRLRALIIVWKRWNIQNQHPLLIHLVFLLFLLFLSLLLHLFQLFWLHFWQRLHFLSFRLNQRQ